MAQRKMLCALQRDTSKILVASEREERSSLRSTGRRRNPGNSLQERAPSPAKQEDGCVQLSFFTVYPDGFLRLIHVPLRCRYHTQLEFIAAKNASESNVPDDSGNTAVTIEATVVPAETNELSRNSSKNSMASVDHSDFLPANSTFGSSSDCSKPKKAPRKNSKKKAKKKRKQLKKNSPRSGSTESEVCSEEISNNDSKQSGNTSCDTVEDTRSKETSDVDIFADGLSGTEDSCISDSVPAGKRSEDSSHPGFNETQEGNLSNYRCDTSTANGLVPDVRVSPGGKKGKVNKAPTNSASYKVSASGSSHARKENNHSVWQKVEKGQAIICGSDEKNADSVDPETSLVLKEIPSVINITSAEVSSNTEDQGFIKVKASRKLKRKCGAGSKQEDNSGSRNGSYHVTKAISVHTKVNTQQKRRLPVPHLVNNETTTRCVPRNHPQNASHTVVPSLHKAECASPSPNMQVSDDVLPKSYVSAIKSNHPKAHSRVYLPHLIFKEVAEAGKETHVKTSEEGHIPPSVEEKERSVGEDDTVLSSMSISDNSSVTPSDESLSPRATEEEDVAHYSISSESSTMEDKERSAGEEDTVLSSMSISDNSSVTPSDECLSPRGTEEEDVAHHSISSESNTTEDKERSVGEDDTVLSSMSISDNSSVTPSDESLSPRGTEDVAVDCIPSESAEPVSTNAVSAACTQITKKSTASDKLETESKLIEQAVADVLRCRLVSDAYQKATGVPAAEIERLIHSASPELCQSYNLRTRRTGLPDQVFGPNISLGSLWRWYEKHGSYGLEVMANDFNDLKKSGFGHGNSFRAYFVPYLSAVQLFGSPDAPHMGEKEHAKSASGNEFNEYELLYEYFEYEQPQRRRPFYEKIKELIKGGSMPWKMYGDPSILTSVDMKNLHPRSWYAVAWYPIYRIPDDSFRASFLTYHSLGHFSRGDTNSSGANAPVVSPVVGLLSYNAQNECWFKPRHTEIKQTAGTRSTKPADILRDRVTSLRNTACHMSRSTVYKGNAASLNRHPDFEFFISRQY